MIILYIGKLRCDVKNLQARVVYLLMIRAYRLEVRRLKVNNETVVKKREKKINIPTRAHRTSHAEIPLRSSHVHSVETCNPSPVYCF
jgi:hypothetical protein